MKRLMICLLAISLLISSCSPDASSDSWIDKLTGPINSPTPTATATPQPKARISLGEDDILAGDYEAALNQFWTAREQSTDPEVISTAQLGVGRVLLMQANYTGAVEQLNWLLSNVSEGETRNTAYFYLAQAYVKLEQYSQAAEAYGNYLQAQPGPLDSEIYDMQGDAFFNAADYANALTAYQMARQKITSGSSESLDIKIARTISVSGDDGGAINTLFDAL